MGIIQIDETVMNVMNYRSAAAGPNINSKARSRTAGSTKIRPTSSFHVTPTATPTRTTRRPRSNSSSSCDSSNSWAPRRTKNRKQHHNHNHSNNHNRPASSPRRKICNNKNQVRTALHEEEQRDRYVAMDCEMVGTGVGGRQSMVARVTIIDWDCKVLLDTFVKPTSEVTDYRTFVSGIAPENLVEEEQQQQKEEEEGNSSDSSSSCNSSDSTLNGVSLVDIETCQQKVLEILKGKVLVGHALKNDLHALDITHPWYDTRDTAKYEPFMKVRFDDGILWPRKLKDLVNEKLNYEIQITGKPHSAYEDAKAALDVYRCAQYKWEKAMEYKIKKTKQIMERQQEQQNKQ